MESATDAVKRYEMLAERALVASREMDGVPAAHDTLFRPSAATVHYYETLYRLQHGKSLPARRPGGATCNACARFHLAQRKAIDKARDIQLGNRLEAVFQTFLSEQLADACETPLSVERADTENLHMPDLRVVRTADRAAIAYCELKVIFRPFLQISSKVNPTFECYSHSLTLDLANGKKLQDQRDLVERDAGVDRVAYVYWYDLPCIKGVFWMPASQVYRIMDEQIPYNRRETAGDYGASGAKRGATQKIYLPLLRMADLNALIRDISERG